MKKTIYGVDITFRVELGGGGYVGAERGIKMPLSRG